MGRLKIGIYSPYLDTASGGEKYILTIAEVFSKTMDVEVLLDPHLVRIGIEKLKSLNEKRHSLDLSNVKFIEAPIGKDSSFLKRCFFLKKYDCFFYNTDGSIFYSTAKKNFIHFQLPLENCNTSIWGQIKLRTWNKAIYNSIFTKDHIERKWKINGEVLCPPVDVDLFKLSKKKKQIVSVGRFVSDDTKKQSVMIDIFTKLVKENDLKDWSLHLAGGMMNGNEEYVKNLKIKSKGLKVFFYENIKHDELIKLYSESMIYWHAMGYDEDNPKKMEHFGITTVESMASGCIPIVINKGGQTEIVKDGINGFMWDSIDECIEKTMLIIKNSKKREEVSNNALKTSTDFSKHAFEDKIKRLVYEN